MKVNTRGETHTHTNQKHNTITGSIKSSNIFIIPNEFLIKIVSMAWCGWSGMEDGCLVAVGG